MVGYLDSINEAVKKSVTASEHTKKSSKSSQMTKESDENNKSDSVAIFTQKLVAGELTEQLMRFVV